MGIHHFTDYLCGECKEYAGDTLGRCGDCEGEYCPSCLNTEYTFFKKIKTNKRKNENGIEESKNNNESDDKKDIDYYINSDDYEECTEDDIENDDIKIDDFVEVGYKICNSCDEKKNSYCECCCSYNQISRSRCSCYKFVCDNCKIILENDKPLCWLCIQNKNDFKNWLKNELNCSSMANIITKYNEHTGSASHVSKMHESKFANCR